MRLPTLFAVCILPSLASAQSARGPVGEAPPARSVPTLGTVDAAGDPAATSVTFAGHVFEPDGAPGVGALVFSSAGGKAVVEQDGSYRLEVGLPRAALSVRLTAVGRGRPGLLASEDVELFPDAGLVPVRPLTLAESEGCPHGWLPTFGGRPGVDDQVFAIQGFDDGGGAALYVGGDFSLAGGGYASRIAKWNGTTWLPLDSGVDDRVRALAVYDDGNGVALYVGGAFTTAGGVAASGIAKWDGSSWSTLGSGMDDAVHALAVYDDGGGEALYAGGEFTSAGGLAASRVTRWDGSSWSALGSGTNGAVNALTVFDDGGGDALHTGGEFTSAGGSAANGIAKWDGSSWSSLGSGLSFVPGFGGVTGMAVYDDGGGEDLHVAGSFSMAGGVSASNIARWDGSSWAALGSGLNWPASALTVLHDGPVPGLYVGGAFTTAGGLPANNIARWNGSSWEVIGAGATNGTQGVVNALATFDDGGGEAVYAGGTFSTVGGLTANRVVKRDNTLFGAWTVLGDGIGGGVRALAVYDDGGGPALHAGGGFTTAGGAPTDRVAKWTGSEWSPLASGTDGTVNALAVFDDGAGERLFVGGLFQNAGTAAFSRNIAKWDGQQWFALDVGTSGTVYDMVAFDDGGGQALYVGGTFNLASGLSVNKIARWDGSSWSALESGVGGFVLALAVFDDGGGEALYAAGSFTTAGGVPADRIAKWDGSSWSALGSGTNGAVNALTVFDDGGGEALYAAGSFTTAGGVPADRIAKWDGSSWSPVGSGMDDIVRALEVFDEGSGAALYAGGDFSTAGGAAATRIAKWNGSSWLPLGSGTDDDVYAMAACDDEDGASLCIGGSFVSAFDSDDSYVARWGPVDTVAPAITCPGDMLVYEVTTATGEPATRVSFLVDVTDACDPAAVVVVVPASGSVFPRGTTTVTCTASDAAGNESMCTFDVTVRPRGPRCASSSPEAS